MWGCCAKYIFRLLLWSVLYERGNRWWRNNLEATSTYTMCNCIPEPTNSFPLFPHWRLSGDGTWDLNLSRAVANLESLNYTLVITVSSRPRFPYCSRKCKAGVEPITHLQRRRWCIPRLGVEAQRPADLKWPSKNLSEWRRSFVFVQGRALRKLADGLTLYVSWQGHNICFVLPTFVVAIGVQVALFYLPVESFTDQEQVSDLYRPSSVFKYAFVVYGKY
jgi:hypothetical protein